MRRLGIFWRLERGFRYDRRSRPQRAAGPSAAKEKSAATFAFPSTRYAETSRRYALPARFSAGFGSGGLMIASPIVL